MERKQSKLSILDSETIKQATHAIDLVIDGAMQRLNTQYGPDDMQDRGFAIDSLILHAREALQDHSTRFELGMLQEELTVNETSLCNLP